MRRRCTTALLDGTGAALLRRCMRRSRSRHRGRRRRQREHGPSKRGQELEVSQSRLGHLQAEVHTIICDNCGQVPKKPSSFATCNASAAEMSWQKCQQRHSIHPQFTRYITAKTCTPETNITRSSRSGEANLEELAPAIHPVYILTTSCLELSALASKVWPRMSR
jgi:hypothetical protein